MPGRGLLLLGAPQEGKGAADLRLRGEEGERQRKIIEAQGIRSFSDISRIDILKWRGLQATEALAKSANAKVIVIGSGQQLPIILGSDR